MDLPTLGNERLQLSAPLGPQQHSPTGRRGKQRFNGAPSPAFAAVLHAHTYRETSQSSLLVLICHLAQMPPGKPRVFLLVNQQHGWVTFQLKSQGRAAYTHK